MFVETVVSISLLFFAVYFVIYGYYFLKIYLYFQKKYSEEDSSKTKSFFSIPPHIKGHFKTGAFFSRATVGTKSILMPTSYFFNPEEESDEYLLGIYNKVKVIQKVYVVIYVVVLFIIILGVFIPYFFQ